MLRVQGSRFRVWGGRLRAEGLGFGALRARRLVLPLKELR